MNTTYTKGLDKFHFAPLTSDTEGAVTYSVPIALAKAQSVQIKPTVVSADIPGDNFTETEQETTGSEITIQKSSLLSDELSILLGERTVDGIKCSGNAPYGAFGYRRTFNNGISRLVWILKSKFRDADTTINTKDKNNLNPQYDSLVANSTRRICDNEWKIYKEGTDLTTQQINTFFSKATLERLYNVANPLHLQPTPIKLVDELPATGEGGILYVVGDDMDLKYWNGSSFVEAEIEE